MGGGSPRRDPDSTPGMDVNDRTRTLLMAIRQAIIMALGAIEDYLQMRRSIVPRRERESRNQGDSI